jgi:putative transposase
MPRRPRIEVAGGIHHVTARAPYGRVLFVDEEDRLVYATLLAREVEQSRWEVLSHCQMTNHVHLLIRTPEPNLGHGMKTMHERFANHVNRRHRQHGHVFGSRFANRLVVEDAHFQACLRYIARNPVEAGMCASAAEWRWSAHRELLGLADGGGCLAAHTTLAFLGPTIGAGRIAYQQLLAADTEDLVRSWGRRESDRWMPAAVDVLGFTVDGLAQALGISRGIALRRLRAARGAG